MVYWDVDYDGFCVPKDALLVINHLNALVEGEAAADDLASALKGEPTTTPVIPPTLGPFDAATANTGSPGAAVSPHVGNSDGTLGISGPSTVPSPAPIAVAASSAVPPSRRAARTIGRAANALPAWAVDELHARDRRIDFGGG